MSKNQLPVMVSLLLLLANIACTDTATTLCATGIRCPADQGCAANQPACITGPCGNGVVDMEEACDDGNIVSGDGCSSDCRSNETCGNGYQDTAEVCDDNNNSSRDGCSSDCRSRETCGNSVVDRDIGETCDDGNRDFGDGCNADCTSDESCGNAVVDLGEECDCGLSPATPREQECAGQNNVIDQGFCRRDCRIHCGDGEITLGEECDTGALLELSCTAIGYDFGRVSCSSSCDSLMIDGCHTFNWSSASVPVFDVARINAIWGTSPSDIWIVGESSPSDEIRAMFFHYNGKHWRTVVPAPANSMTKFNQIWGSSPTDIFVVGLDLEEEGSQLLHFDGLNWESMHFPYDEEVDLGGIWGSSSSNVFVVGTVIEGNSLVLHYNGSTWNRMHTPTMADLTDVWGSSDKNIIAVGDGGTILHFNGLQWRQFPAPTSEDLTAVWGSAEDNVFAVGDNGTLIRFNGTNWQTMGLPAIANFADIWGTAPDNILLSGQKLYSDRGTVLAWDGVFLKELITAMDYEISRLWGVDDKTIFGVSRLLNLIRHDGYTFAKVYIPFRPEQSWVDSTGEFLAIGSHGESQTKSVHFRRTSSRESVFYGDINDIWGSGSSDIFGVGDDGNIFRYDGSRWSPMDSPTENGLMSIWGSSMLDITAVGRAGTILRYDGVDWRIVPSGTQEDLLEISGIDQSSIYAVGTNGTLLHYDGMSWNPAFTPFPVSDTDLTDILALAPDNLLVVDSENTLWKYDGFSWQMESFPDAHTEVNDLWADDAGGIWAVGDHSGLFYRTRESPYWERVRVPNPDEDADFYRIRGAGRRIYIWGEDFYELSHASTLTW